MVSGGLVQVASRDLQVKANRLGPTLQINWKLVVTAEPLQRMLV